MSLIVGFILAMVFLEGWWRLAIIVPLAGLELFEIYIYLRWRKVRAQTGAEAMVGVRGRALTDLRPEGQVKVRGQIWKARSRAGIEAGDDVVVTDVNGLALTVERVEPIGSEGFAGR